VYYVPINHFIYFWFFCLGCSLIVIDIKVWDIRNMLSVA
jgi:hypothetical protein